MGWKFRSLNEVDPTEGTVTLVKLDGMSHCVCFCAPLVFGSSANVCLVASRRLNLKGDGKDDGIILIPQPTNDVNDPLNWPKWKKVMAILAICIYSSVSEWQVTGVATAIVQIEKYFKSNLNETSTGLITWNLFALGIGVSSLALH